MFKVLLGDNVAGAELGDRHSLEGAKARSGPCGHESSPGSQAKLKTCSSAGSTCATHLL